MNLEELRDALERAAEDLPPTPGDHVSEVLRRASRRKRHERRIILGVPIVAVGLAVPLVIAFLPSQSKPERVVVGNLRAPPASVVPGGVPELGSGTWEAMADGPLAPRPNPIAAWTGREIILWGGLTGAYGSPLYGDGGALDPLTGTWRTLPAAPISPRADALGVWTGTELVIWGGFDRMPAAGDSHQAADGAFYDPTTDSWRRLAPSPLSARADSGGVWDGREVLVFGGLGVVGAPNPPLGLTDNAAYDPAHNRWRSLAALPAVAGHNHDQAPQAVWVGDRALTWWPWTGTGVSAGHPAGSGVDLYSFDPRTNRWTHLSSQPDEPLGVSGPIWTGTEVLIPATAPYVGEASTPPPMNVRGERYDPRTNTWHLMAQGPLDSAGETLPTVWTGSALVRLSPIGANSGAGPGVQPVTGEAWDPQVDAWAKLPSEAGAFTTMPTAIWTTTAGLVLTDGKATYRLAPPTPTPATNITAVTGPATQKPPPLCQANQLQALLEGIQGATGNWAAGFWVVDTSAEACALRSPVRLDLLDNSGRVRLSATQTFSDSIELSARSAFPPANPPVAQMADVTLFWPTDGSFSRGTCPTPDFVPSAVRIVFAGTSPITVTQLTDHLFGRRIAICGSHISILGAGQLGP